MFVKCIGEFRDERYLQTKSGRASKTGLFCSSLGQTDNDRLHPTILSPPYNSSSISQDGPNTIPQLFAPHSFLLPTTWIHHPRRSILPSENACTSPGTTTRPPPKFSELGDGNDKGAVRVQLTCPAAMNHCGNLVFSQKIGLSGPCSDDDSNEAIPVAKGFRKLGKAMAYSLPEDLEPDMTLPQVDSSLDDETDTVSVRRTLTEKLELSGRSDVNAVNFRQPQTYKRTKHPDGSIDIRYLETIPWIDQFYLHTLVPKANGCRSTLYTATFHIPANATPMFTIDMTNAFLRCTEQPPAARRVGAVPVECGGPRATYRHLYPPPLLITLATPDFSMPYDMIILTCTVVVFILLISSFRIDPGPVRAYLISSTVTGAIHRCFELVGRASCRQLAVTSLLFPDMVKTTVWRRPICQITGFKIQLDTPITTPLFPTWTDSSRRTRDSPSYSTYLSPIQNALSLSSNCTQLRDLSARRRGVKVGCSTITTIKHSTNVEKDPRRDRRMQAAQQACRGRRPRMLLGSRQMLTSVVHQSVTVDDGNKRRPMRTDATSRYEDGVLKPWKCCPVVGSQEVQDFQAQKGMLFFGVRDSKMRKGIQKMMSKNRHLESPHSDAHPGTPGSDPGGYRVEPSGTRTTRPDNQSRGLESHRGNALTSREGLGWSDLHGGLVSGTTKWGEAAVTSQISWCPPLVEDKAYDEKEVLSQRSSSLPYPLDLSKMSAIEGAAAGSVKPSSPRYETSKHISQNMTTAAATMWEAIFLPKIY
ncbi:Gpi16 subunit, GPI transamidase component-domain-containing protein [Coprinopsis sp. MPI-PUGE-AT-0042]|nr:Gpi16 subunit, GPI transamidase component-domain-containing protein [Coprinopsis sp. MPI-PUGE-AT-0042]